MTNIPKQIDDWKPFHFIQRNHMLNWDGFKCASHSLKVLQFLYKLMICETQDIIPFVQKLRLVCF